jgi:hypothetical protein
MVKHKGLVVAISSTLIIAYVCWSLFRTSSQETDARLPWRVTREEVEHKAPLGSTYKTVVDAFGRPTREIRFGLSDRSVSYMSDTNLSTPGTY